MTRKCYTTEEIIRKLREADILVGQGKPWQILSSILGCEMSPYYRGRKEYGGLKVDQAERFKELEKSILREAASENF